MRLNSLDKREWKGQFHQARGGWVWFKNQN